MNHFTRVLTAWWKAAHYVQNRDTADYYNNITGLLVQSPRALYEWPALVEGVIIDAPRGGEGVKENPKVSYSYEDGFEYLANAPLARQVKVRSFATGGTRRTAQTQKRFRPDDDTTQDETTQTKKTKPTTTENALDGRYRDPSERTKSTDTNTGHSNGDTEKTGRFVIDGDRTRCRDPYSQQRSPRSTPNPIFQ